PNHRRSAGCVDDVMESLVDLSVVASIFGSKGLLVDKSITGAKGFLDGFHLLGGHARLGSAAGGKALEGGTNFVGLDNILKTELTHVIALVGRVDQKSLTSE